MHDITPQLLSAIDGLLAGTRSREDVRAWAVEMLAEGGFSPFRGALGGAHQAMVALDIAMPEWFPIRPSPWFIDEAVLRDWQAILSGSPRVVHREDGWTVTTWGDAPLEGGVLAGHFPEKPGTLQRILGTPCRSRSDFASWEGWDLTAPDGTPIILFRHLGYEAGYEAGYGQDAGFDVRAFGDPDHALRLLDALLDVPLDDAFYRHPSVTIKPAWVLRRMDDNGNEFQVSRHLTEAGARRALAWRTSFHHKQTWWIAPLA